MNRATKNRQRERLGNLEGKKNTMTLQSQLDLVPLMSRIIVKRKEVPKESVEKVGSFYVPDISKRQREFDIRAKIEETTEGTVLAIGNEVDLVKVGDQIFFGKYAGAEIKRKGEDYVVMTQEDIIALVKK